MKRYLTVVPALVALELAALAGAGGVLYLLREAGYRSFVEGWPPVVAFLVLIAALVVAGLRALPNPDGGLRISMLAGALLFTVLLLAPMLVLFAADVTGIAGEGDNQSPRFKDEFPDLAMIVLILGPAFGAVVALLDWGSQRTLRLIAR